MSRIRSKDTRPEKTVRSLLHSMGYRFRINRTDLPGKPDIVLPKHQTVIFVHGCFWHRHKNCKRCTIPKTRTEFWLQKFEKNVLRDKKNQKVLRKLGWRIIVVWECQTKRLDALRRRLENKLKIN